jgi:hypothetical protein
MKSVKIKVIMASVMCTLLFGVTSANANCELSGQDLVVVYSLAKKNRYIYSSVYGLPGRLGIKGTNSKPRKRSKSFKIFNKPLKHGWTINTVIVKSSGLKSGSLRVEKKFPGVIVKGTVKRGVLKKWNIWATRIFVFGPQNCTAANKQAMIRSMFQ